MMGAAPITQVCECGASGASVWLVDDRGRESTEPVCWDCAMEKRTPIPPGSPLAAVVALLGGWHRTREGARWLARRLEAQQTGETRADPRRDG